VLALLALCCGLLLGILLWSWAVLSLAFACSAAYSCSLFAAHFLLFFGRALFADAFVVSMLMPQADFLL
jgi:hypothetical protein